jgi:hypothetical protein
MTTAVDNWPAYARLLAVASAGQLPTAPTPLGGTQPRQVVNKALRIARDKRARVGLCCDTQAQAEAMADRATRLLPRHRRISFERAEAGRWGRGGMQ